MQAGKTLICLKEYTERKIRSTKHEIRNKSQNPKCLEFLKSEFRYCFDFDIRISYFHFNDSPSAYMGRKGCCSRGTDMPARFAVYQTVSAFFRYLVAGGTAAMVDLGLLYILPTFPYSLPLGPPSGRLSYLFRQFSASEVLDVPKYGNGPYACADDGVFLVAVANLALNTLLMYLFVDYFHIWYVLAQVPRQGLLPVSFFISRHILCSKGRPVRITHGASPLRGEEEKAL